MYSQLNSYHRKRFNVDQFFLSEGIYQKKGKPKGDPSAITVPEFVDPYDEFTFGDLLTRVFLISIHLHYRSNIKTPNGDIVPDTSPFFIKKDNPLVGKYNMIQKFFTLLNYEEKRNYYEQLTVVLQQNPPVGGSGSGQYYFKYDYDLES